MKPKLSEASHLIRSRRTFSLAGEDFCQLLIDVLQKGTAIRFKTKGSSMHPFIKDGDVVTVKPRGNTEPRLGHVIAFSHPVTKRAVIHRIIGKKSGHFITKGDNSMERDGLLPGHYILGMVSRIERNNRPVRLGLGLESYFIALIGKHKPLQVGLHSLLKIGRRTGDRKKER